MFKNIFSSRGRIGRIEYALSFIACIIVCVFFVKLYNTYPEELLLIFFLPVFGICVFFMENQFRKRMQDCNYFIIRKAWLSSNDYGGYSKKEIEQFKEQNIKIITLKINDAFSPLEDMGYFIECFYKKGNENSNIFGPPSSFF